MLTERFKILSKRLPPNSEEFPEVLTKTSKTRDYSKTYPCLYCQKLVLKLPDHLLSHYEQEEDVNTLKSLPTKSKERMLLISKLRGMGTFKHNEAAILSGKGKLIPKSRGQVPVSPSKMIACVFCGETFRKSTYYKHKKTCALRSMRPEKTAHRLPATKVSTFMLGRKISDSLKLDFEENILMKMKADAISKAVKGDSLILSFGLVLLDNLSGREDIYNHIRNKLRELGRLLIQLKEGNADIGSLGDILNPGKFEAVVEATLSISGYRHETATFAIPSLAKRVGESLQKCASIATKDAIISGNRIKKEEISDFLSLHEMDWSKRISSKATFNLKELKYNKVTQLPEKEDVLKVADFMAKESVLAFNNLKGDTNNVSFYNRLALVTLASVILLNRKRPGDTHKLWITTYRNSKSAAPHSDILNSLSERQKELVQSLKRVETRGKKGMKVAILFTQQMQSAIELMLSCREQCSVPEENKYVFGAVATNSFYRGSDALRWCRQQSGCQHPERFTATCLRKEAATLAKISGLNEIDVEELATFLGHDIATHKNYYRLPEATIQTAKVSEYLLKISGTSNGEIVDGSSASDSDGDDDIAKSSMRNNQQDPPLRKQSKACKRKSKSDACSRGKMIRQEWTSPQKRIVFKHLGSNLSLNQLPGKQACELVLRESPMKTRKWTDVKNFCRNEIRKRLQQAANACNE